MGFIPERPFMTMMMTTDYGSLHIYYGTVINSSEHNFVTVLRPSMSQCIHIGHTFA